MFFNLVRRRVPREDASSSGGETLPHVLSDVEISPRVYRSGPLTATFTHKGAFVVRRGDTTVAGAPDFRDYEGALSSIIDDDVEDPEVRAAATTILETARRSLYDQYVVIDGEDDV
jgi:hypothetical protein